jgi:hypothetical protein
MLVKAIRRKLESPIPVPETLSTFHLRAQRTAFRRRNERPQSRSFKFRHQNVTCVSLSFSATRLHEKNFYAPRVWRSAKKVGLCLAR